MQEAESWGQRRAASLLGTCPYLYIHLANCTHGRIEHDYYAWRNRCRQWRCRILNERIINHKYSPKKGNASPHQTAQSYQTRYFIQSTLRTYPLGHLLARAQQHHRHQQSAKWYDEYQIHQLIELSIWPERCPPYAAYEWGRDTKIIVVIIHRSIPFMARFRDHWWNHSLRENVFLLKQ